MSTPSSTASSALDDLVAWCVAHPVPDTDAERFLRYLNSGPASIVDRRADGAVCVIMDRARSGAGWVPLELAGCASLNGDLAEALVTAAAEQARSLGLRGIDLMITDLWAPHRRRIEAAGFSFAYGDLDMRCATPDWGQDVVLPSGLAWRNLDDALIDDFLRLYRAAFDGMPGVYFPDEAEQRRIIATRRGSMRVLCDDKRV